MALYLLNPAEQQEFAEKPEVFPNAQAGLVGSRFCLVLACQIAVIFDKGLKENLTDFYAQTWGKHSNETDIEALYAAWMESLDDRHRQSIKFQTKTRREMLDNIEGSNPPPPPDRPDLQPVTPGPPDLIIEDVHGHLPFETVTRPREVFYRFEPWPNSRRVLQSSNSVVANTFAAPQSELFFNPTGFAAVARNALPNLFPACFRWEIQPTVKTAIYCGAIVPMFGQSGGGVEVYFTTMTPNRGPIANPVIIEPL
jgi:hypothetical protein